MNQLLGLGFVFLVSAAAAVLVALLLASFSRPLRLIDPPGARKSQSQPVPLVGGPAILVGAAVGWLMVMSWLPGEVSGGERLAALTGAMFLAGLVDDLTGKRLRAGAKSLLTLTPLALAALLEGGSDAVLFAAVAFIALHSFNTIDHENGVLGLVALPTFLALAWALWQRHAGAAALAALTLAGGVLGFLFLNFPRARLFVGDSGSLLLGGAMAAALVEWKRPELLLFATVPLADLSSVAWLRLRAGERPWLGDRRHVTHRLAARGIAPARAALALGLLQAAFSVAGALLFARPPLPAAAAWGLAAAAIGTTALLMLAVAPLVPDRTLAS